MKSKLKIKLLLLFLLTFLQNCREKKSDFLIRELHSNHDSPLIFYLSGDAGFNTFSKKLSNQIFERNYDITALDSKTYFWTAKTPRQTTKDITNYLKTTLKTRKNQKIVLLGYSFGADVLAFIVNRLPPEIHQKLVAVIFLDPSKTADFEVSLQGMLFDKARGDYEVLPEINKMKVPKTLIIRSNIGLQFPANKITVPNFTVEHLAGNHRFNYEYGKLADLITREIASP